MSMPREKVDGAREEWADGQMGKWASKWCFWKGLRSTGRKIMHVMQTRPFTWT